MSLTLKTALYLYDSGGYAFFNDITGTTSGSGYGQDGNITYADVEGIRIKTANYLTITNTSSPINGIFVQYTEYIKTGGLPETINGKTFVSGNTFVPQFTSLSTAQPANWLTTGYYVYPFLAAWLPTAAEVPLNIPVAKFGQSGSVIEDNIYVYDYEVYDTLHTVDFTSVADKTYMILAGNSTYGGSTYYAGEVFTASDASTIAVVTGSVVELYAATSSYAALIYQIESGLDDLIEQQIGFNNQDLIEPVEGYILKIRAKIEALKNASKTNNVSLLDAYQTIIYLQERLTQLLNP